MRKRPLFFYGWVIVAVAGITIAVSYGIRYSFPGAFYPAILDEFGWNRADTASIFSVFMIIYGLSALTAGTLVDKFGARKVLLLGVAILVLGTALSSQGKQIWHFYLTFGVLTSFGMALVGYTPLVILVSNWFVRRRGMAFGIIGAGLGLSFLFALLAQSLILSLSWPSAYLILAGMVAGILFPLLTLLPRQRPQDMGLLPDGTSEAEQVTTSQRGEVGDVVDQKWVATEWTLSRATKTVRFWALVVLEFIFFGIGLHLILVHQRVFLSDVGFSPMFAVTIFSLYGVFSAVGNLCGFISDRIGREKTFTLGVLGSILGVVSLLLTGDTSQPWLPYLFAVVFGLSMGMCMPTLSATIADLFQGKHFGSVIGLIICGWSLGAAVGPWVGGRIYDSTGSYTAAFILVIAVLVTSLPIIWIISPRKVRLVGGRVSRRSAGRNT